MAVSTSYRLPGVYSEETTGPFVNAVAGGNAVVALIGPAVGYSTAAQQVTLVDLTPVDLNETGVIEGSVVLSNRVGGTTYVNGVDFYEAENADTLVTSVRRNLSSLSLAKSSVSGMTHTYYTAEPSFDIMIDGSGDEIDGYPIAGTVIVVDTTADPAATLVDGTDYDVDYHSGFVTAKAGGALSDPEANGHVLSISYDWTTAEPMELVGESAFVLEHKYISENGLGTDEPYTCNIVCCDYEQDGVEYSYGDTPNASEGYVENVDFVVDYQSGRITRTAASRIPSFDSGVKNYMYIEFAYCAIRSGEQLIANYSYQDAEYTQPRLVSSYADAAKYYGEAWDTDSGDVISPLSMGAYIAFQNGMGYCYMCAVEGSVTSATNDGVTVTSVEYSTTAWENAFNQLTLIDGIDIIVPLTSDQSNWAFGVSHLATMKANQDERVMIIGADGTVVDVDASGMISVAQSFSSDDVWVVAPSTFRFRNPIRGVVEVVPGYYAAAAVAGYNSSVAQYVPLTRKAVNGFYSSNVRATKQSKQNQCANGLMYIDEVNGQLRILHGRTTSTANIVKAESNVVLTKYFIIKRMRRMFETGYIGEIITDDTLLSVKSSASSILSNLRSNNYLYDFQGLTVEVDELIPTQVNISFEYIPVYGMNYIQISFSVNSGIVA